MIEDISETEEGSPLIKLNNLFDSFDESNKMIEECMQKLIKPRPKQRYYWSNSLLFRHDETICSWPIDLRQHDMRYQKHLDNDDIIDFFKRIFHLKRKFETFWIGGDGGG